MSVTVSSRAVSFTIQTVKEFIYSRNAVYETLRARRRQVFALQIAEGAQEKGRLAEILRLAEARRIPVHRAPRPSSTKSIPSTRASSSKPAAPRQASV